MESIKPALYVLMAFLIVTVSFTRCGEEPETEDGEKRAAFCDFVCVSQDPSGHSCEWECEVPELLVTCGACHYEIKDGAASWSCTSCDVGAFDD